MQGGNYQSTDNADSEGQNQSLIPGNNNNSNNQPSKKKYNFFFYGFIIIILLFIGLAIFTIIYITDNDDKDSSSDTPPDSSLICTTEECIALSSTILSWMNTSADPCINFFEYACGGFKEKYRYQLSKYPQWTTEWSNVNVMGEIRRNAFLDFLYDENDPLAQRQSIIAIKTFYKSCYDSTIEEEDLATTQLLKQFINTVNFTDGNFNDTTWDSQSAQGFQNALSWLSLR